MATLLPLATTGKPGVHSYSTGICTHWNYSFLYVLAPITTTIDVLNVNVAGQAEMVQNFNFSSAAQEAGVTISELSYLALFDSLILLKLFSILRCI